MLDSDKLHDILDTASQSSSRSTGQMAMLVALLSSGEFAWDRITSFSLKWELVSSVVVPVVNMTFLKDLPTKDDIKAALAEIEALLEEGIETLDTESIMQAIALKKQTATTVSGTHTLPEDIPPPPVFEGPGLDPALKER